MRCELQKYFDAKKICKKNILFLFWILVYKTVLELGYAYILAWKVQYFQMDFSIWKYAVGTIWVIVLFLNIRHDERKVSTFILNLHLIIAIIPIAVIYGLWNKDSVYFNLLCCAFLIAELILKLKWRPKGFSTIRIRGFSHLIPFGCGAIVIGMVGYIMLTNGLPTLTALNILDVYELRRDAYFISNKYINYIFVWMMTVFLPFTLSYFLVKKKYVLASLCVAIALLFYLYSGNKTSLFMIPLVVGAYLFAMYKNTNYTFFGTLTLGIALTIPLAKYMELPFSLFVRRALIIPANLKFVYYDFFSNNPKLGFAGTLWGSKLGVVDPYDQKLGYIISEEYFGLPQMNSNTGFLAEGYSRFGFIGISLALIVFAIVLMLLDRLQARIGYTFSVTLSIYPLYTLNDGLLIDSLIFGPMLALLLIILLYHDNFGKEKEGEGLRWKMGQIPKISI
jgi:hypothetical protein